LDPPTLRDVARAAGVSTATASRALAGDGFAVTDALRARVRAAAARLGYVPNLAARALATRRSGVIGVMVSGLADAMVAAALTGCEQGLAAAGYRVLVVAADSPRATLAGTQDILGRGAQALIFLQTVPSAEIVRLAAANGIVCITVGDDSPSTEGIGAALSLGRGEGAGLAARYLASLGHRRFGLIGAPQAMLEAVQRALMENPIGTEVAVPGDGLDPGQAMRHLLERTEPPTAVLCASDVCALAALRECMIRGVAVPEQVSLIGFGDAEFARWAHPALSTIRVGTSEIGLRAARAALARLEGLEFEAARSPIKLIVRESTAGWPS
jgi:DNA-binding LacI/PurR family transcriptional regulator